MDEIEPFLEKFNNLVIGDETTREFQIIHVGTAEPWNTFPAPADVDEIKAAISNIGRSLATGQQVLRLQAVGSGGSLRGQISIEIEGRSPAARQSGNEMINHAKATAMNVETADRQLSAMSARLQAADMRAQEAEERAGRMTGDVWKMAELANKMLMDKESAILDREEREARIQNMAKITETLVPILGQALVLGSKYMEYKVQVWEAKWAADAAAKTAKATEQAKTNEPN